MTDDMDSDTCVAFKRTINDFEETQTLPQRSDSSSAIPEDSHSSEIVSPLKQDADFIDKSSPCLASESSKKIKLSPHGQVSETHLEEPQEIPNSANEKAVALDFVSGFPTSDGVAQDFMENCEVVGLVSDSGFMTTETAKTLDDDKKGEEEVGSSGIQKLMQETKSATESFEKAAESQSSLEAKKKQLLEEVEAILVPAEKPQVKPAAEGSASSFKVKVIDDTALMILPGSGRGKELGFAQTNGNKDAKQEMNGKKARSAGQKEKVENRLVEASSLSLEKEKGTKISYSRKELEAMRFVNVVEQKKLWKDIYSGLGPVVAKEYDNMASAKQQKNAHYNFEPHKRLEKMEAGPGILGESFSENVDIELETLVNKDEDGYPFQEKECTEDYDSDEDYASIQRPAFAVEGEPNFESGSPEDGLEYLRRVRWEANQIPKVKIAKVDRSKFNKDQSAYMPKIPEIAKCPEQLMPLKQWEDAFLAEFSELRLALSHFEGSNASTSHGKFEKFANLESQEVDFHWPHDCSIVGSSRDQPSSSTNIGSNASLPAENLIPKTFASQSSSDTPLLSVILKMDSLARASMLRKCIKAVEDMNALSRNDCLWLFALCVVVDTPLDADTSASLRSLLRKCAALRAAKSILDVEAVMLNILAMISGRYFGQSEN